MVLSVDPGSHSCGIALFENGILLISKTFTSESKAWGKRFSEILEQYNQFIESHKIEILISELTPSVSHPGLRAILGLFLSHPSCINVSALTKYHFISPSTWKAWARNNGCKDKDPKGVKALRQTKPEYVTKNMTDDAADAVLIALAWIAKNDAA